MSLVREPRARCHMVVPLLLRAMPRGQIAVAPRNLPRDRAIIAASTCHKGDNSTLI